MEQPHICWAEQNPEDWWDATYNTIKEVITKSGVDPKQIKGIGLAGQIFAYTDKVTIDPKGRVHTFCHAVPNTWHIM